MAKINKKILRYNVIFEPNEQGGYNVFFPSFPGCVTFGKTFEEAKKKAKEVLELWLEELAADKKSLPVYRARPIIDEVQVAVSTKTKVTYAPTAC